MGARSFPFFGVLKDGVGKSNFANTVLAMLKKISTWNLAGCLFAFMLAALVAGCGGSAALDGSGGSNPIPTPTPTPTPAVINLVANAGPIIAVRVGDTAVLDGSRSTSGFQHASTFNWSFTHKPYDSTAVLQDATTATPSFIADKKGVYMVQLTVSDSGVISPREVGIVVATIAPERLTGPFNHPGLASNCVQCHNGDIDLVGRPGVILGKSATHLATSTRCQACHTPQDFSVIPYVDHQENFGVCSECHDGVLAVGKSEFHPPTDIECDNCHNTFHFLDLNPDGSFDHSGVTWACTGCHDGIVAIGKNTSHILTDAQCGYCHTTLNFLPAYPDHTGPEVVGKRCASCHGVGTIIGQSVGHPNTSGDCGTCHSITTFSLGGVFDHSLIDSVSQPCGACHNDNNSINAVGKSAAVPNHLTTNADCGSCHNTVAFAGAFIDHTGSLVVGQQCKSCHSNDPSLTHMPIIQDCGVCHTPGTFTSGTYDHTGPEIVGKQCAFCHDNVITAGKFINHMPTSRGCADCHTTTEFVGATFDHVGIDPADCGLCHNGEISLGKPSYHLPTGLDCSSCHNVSNFTSFAGIIFGHQGINPNNCAVCHATGIAFPKSANHIPAQRECSVCHNSTVLFTQTSFLSTVHPSFTHGCQGCHKSTFLLTRPDLVKSGIHVPTDQDCYLCHTTTAFKPKITPFLHVGISENCASCHDGNANHVVVGARGKDSALAHPSTISDCVVCHNTVNFLDVFVDHSGVDVTSKTCKSCHNGVIATGKGAKTNPPHVVTTDDCGTCHISGGTFAIAVFDHTGITNNCASCHDGTTATGLSQNHVTIVANEDCSLCHNTTAFAGAKFDHQGIFGDCFSCHNGTTARGKIPPPNHVPTNDDCVVCHQTTGFVPATFDHVGIVDNCKSCHDAGFATGKSVNHLTTNDDCGVCHTTDTFIGAGFDHTGVVDNCASCHGVTAIGMHANHISTSLDCHFCHTTATFKGGTWTHGANSVGTCDQCHNSNGGGATPKNQGHFNTNEQCDVCHSTNGWGPTIFSHDPNGDYPGDHYKDLGCQKCHGNVIGTPFTWPSPQYAPFCAACHEKNFKSEGKHIGGKSGTVAQNKNCGGSGCHKVSKRKF